MINLNEVKQLEQEEAARRADEAERARKAAEKRHIEHVAWLKDTGFKRAMQEVDAAIAEGVYNSKKSICVSVGYNSDGEFLANLVVVEAEANGYEAFSERRYVPADFGTPTEGYYGHDSYFDYTVTIGWK